MKHFSTFLLIAAILVSVAACGGNSSVPGPAGPTDDNSQASYSLVSSDGFTLKVLDSSFLFGDRAQFSLSVSETDGLSTVTVATDATDLRGLHMQLDYDSNALHPVDASMDSWPEFNNDNQLSLVVSDVPGSVYMGSTIVHPQSNPGANGRFSVASVSFAAGGSLGERRISAVPAGSGSRIPDLSVNAGNGDVSFSYNNVGDYDQNSVVGIADITPLGVNFNADPADGDKYPFESALSIVDGDSNGLITLADITPIGVNFGNQIESWTLYGGVADDYPADAASGNGEASALGTVAFADDTGASKAQFRSRYEVNMSDIVGSGAVSFWLRPVSESTEGISSNLNGEGGVDTDPPFWVGGAPEDAGVMSVVPGDGNVRVNWYEADDTLNWPGTYTVYWNEGSTVDFGTASTMEVAGLAKDDEEAGSEQTAIIPGLTNDTEYAFAVRASDAADPANQEDNSVMLSATPHASQELPSTIDSDLTIDGPATIGLGNTVDFSNDAVLTVNGDLTIAGTLQGGDTDICIIVKGDLVVTGEIVQQLPDEPAVPADDAKSVKIVAEGNADFDGDPFDVNGNLMIVSDEDDLLTPEQAEDDIVNGAFDEFDFTFMPLEEEQQANGVSSVNRGASNHIVYYGPKWTWHMKKDWKKIPVQPHHVKRVVLTVYQRRGQIKATDWNISGPDGRDGGAVTQCDTAVGEDGEDNRFSLRMHASKAITFNNATITMGSGGDGGDANALGCCPTATATGGNGGKPNNKYRITAGNNIVIQNNFTMNPGWGGNGGTATATGGNGIDGCPATDGCDAVATGGKGGDVPLWGMRVRGNVFGGASIVLGKAFGGDGGVGDATGGDGGNDTCCMTAGDGGDATATGGKGGLANYTAGSGFTGTNNGAESGTGGDAFATGGNGGDGADCFKAQAGNGGDGGDASADGGLKGDVTGLATAGKDGDGDAIGGDGGNGGDGFPVGAGGIGGVATATGDTANELDGLDGANGIEWPTGGLWIWCIDIPTFLPDPGTFPGPGDPAVPLPDGTTGTVDLLDSSNMQKIGTVPFTVHDSTNAPGSGIFLSTNNDVPTSPRPQIQMHNNDMPDSEMWIEIELTQLSLDSSLPVNVLGNSFEISQAGFFVPSEIPGFINYFEPDPFLPLGGAAFPPVPYVPGEAFPFEVIPDPALPAGQPSFNFSINVAPLCYLEFFTIYIIDP
ncbi:MAG: hypothetical protein H7A35_10260 [Planctomycetales bacterium]|nr:hypothetical protein [bacterium]UNM07254.1 MAG: hypothetical protein H7A35_10260 [Planctomycetales bacterium]